MSDTNIAVVKLLYTAFTRGNIETIIGTLAPDVEWQSGGEKQDYPVFGLRKGVAQVEEFFRLVSELLDFSDFSPREFFAEKDKVIVLGYYAMTMRKNGRKVACDWVHVVTLNRGKITKFRELTDTAQILEAYRG
jgi:uncharacterized protein